MDVSVSLDQNLAMHRIQSYITNFYSIFYSVYRTNILRQTFKEISKLDPSDLGINELLFSYLNLAQGKIHTIESLTYIRQKGSSQAAASQKDWFYRLFYTNWLEDLKRALLHVAKRIASKEKGDVDQIHSMLYDDFCTKQRSRYLPAEFYLVKNTRNFFNKRNLITAGLYKLSRVLPNLAEKVSLISLCHLSSKDTFKKIKAIVSRL
jgi:hypothetical protein